LEIISILIFVLLRKPKALLQNAQVLVGAIRPPTVKAPIFRIIMRTNINIDIISNTIKFLGQK